MSVTVHFRCGGCPAEAEGTRHLRRQFRGINGKDYGFGVWEEDSVWDVTPTGWLAFDPVTNCCYCPACADSIFGPESTDKEVAP